MRLFVHWSGAHFNIFILNIIQSISYLYISYLFGDQIFSVFLFLCSNVSACVHAREDDTKINILEEIYRMMQNLSTYSTICIREWIVASKDFIRSYVFANMEFSSVNNNTNNNFIFLLRKIWEVYYSLHTRNKNFRRCFFKHLKILKIKFFIFWCTGCSLIDPRF